MTASFLQNYWWFLLSFLAAALVFLLFVQGGQTMIFRTKREGDRQLMVNAIGRKWELTFTTLVVFGGAFFASFPLFYSTSFGGAYWLWMLILFSFIFQAIAYEFRRKPGNLYGSRTFDCLMLISGIVGCVLLGVAVGSMIFGADFTVDRQNLLDPANPVISTWDSPWRGLEAIANIRCLTLGIAILLLARTTGAIYILDNTAGDATLRRRMTRQVVVNGALFVIFFLTFLYMMLTASAYVADANGNIEIVEFGYLQNYCTLWWAALALLVGVILVLWGIVGVIIRPAFRHGTWFMAAGTILVVMSIFWVIGYQGTSYYHSVTDPQSSLTLVNSSSSPYTLRVMAWVSLIIPSVVFYIAYVWAAMGRTPITPDSLRDEPNY